MAKRDVALDVGGGERTTVLTWKQHLELFHLLASEGVQTSLSGT